MIALAVGSLTLVHPGFFLATLRKGKKNMVLP